MPRPSAKTLEQRLALPLFILGVIFLIGTGGYWWLWRNEGATLLDALYMVFITTTTIGYTEVLPVKTPVERVFTMAVGTSGIATLFYVLGVFMDYVVEMSATRRRLVRMERAIERMRDHVIVVGYGRVGRQAAEQLKDSRVGFVVVERDPDRVARAMHDGALVLEGDATDDEVLKRSGVERAHGLIVTTGVDATNLFVVLSARSLNPKLFIVARTEDDSVRTKMLRAGADRVIDPYAVGGRRLANLVVRPAVVDFLETTLRRGGAPLSIEDLRVEAGSVMDGKSLAELEIRKQHQATVLAVIRDEVPVLNPAADFVLRAGDQIIVLGVQEALATLEGLARGSGRRGA